MSRVNRIVETYGFDGLVQTFNNLKNPREKKRILIDAFKKATKPTIEYARSTVNVRTGNLRRAIGAVTIPGNAEIGIYVGARIKGQFRGYHGHLLEEGTVDRFYISKNGVKHNTGKMRYSGFFKKAVDATEKEVISTVANEWEKAIARNIVRTYRRDRQNN